MTDQTWLKYLAITGALLLIIIFILTTVSHFDYTTDDTYIYLQYAKNIISGGGFSFNPGEPTYGTTGPLWALVISVFGFIGFDLLLISKLVDLSFAVLSIFVFFNLAQNILFNQVISFLATITFSLNAWLLRWTGTGMETSFSVLIMLLAVYFSLKNNYYKAVFFSSLLILLRPESFILTLIILTDILLNSEKRNFIYKKLIGSILIALAVTLPWFIFAKITFDTFVPNTALAKATLGMGIADYSWTITDLFKTIFITDAGTFLIFTAGLILILIKNKNFYKTIENIFEEPANEWIRKHFVPLSWVVTLCGLYIVTQANIISRYLLLIIPVIILYSFVFLSIIMRQLNFGKILFHVLFLFTLTIMMQNQYIYNIHIKPSIKAFALGMENCFIPIGKWLKSNTSETDIVMVPDIGAIGFYSDRKICDAAGLVSPEMLTYIRNGFTYKDIMDNKLFTSVCNADYVVHRSNIADEYDVPELQPMFHKVVYGLALSDMSTVYYTVYKVKKENQEEK